MTAYKFLSSGAVGLFSRHAWPTPNTDGPAEWVRIDGEIQQCLNGIHACTKAGLVEWLDDELWEIELDGPVLEADGELIAPAGRLIRRLEGWNGDCARAFVGHCVDNTVEVAAESLVQAGRESEAEALTASRSQKDAELKVLQLARDLEDDQTSPVVFLADVVRLERGGRPELAEEAPTADVGGPTPAALAANLGFVCAHIAAQLAEQESAGAYDESFARERLRQSAWLAEKLQLER
ncbi:MAG: hypothetical protein M3377_04985 [Actinomycetota bacterium]|nr:hypothetical protein [Actinomycetota bacterium]